MGLDTFDRQISRENMKEFMKQRGLKMKPWAEKAGITEGTLRNYLNGNTRSLTVEVLAKLASAADTNIELDGSRFIFRDSQIELSNDNVEQGMQSEIPVLGYLGAGDEINLIFDDFAPGDGMYTVKTPPGCSDRAVGLEVRGNSMYPAYDEGDIVFYERDGQTTIDQRCIGRQSIVKLIDGRLYLKRLSLGSEKGMYTLESFNAPPILNVDVEWAALVKYVQKKY